MSNNRNNMSNIPFQTTMYVATIDIITCLISMALFVTNQAKEYQFNNKPDENMLSKQKSERKLIEYPDCLLLTETMKF